MMGTLIELTGRSGLEFYYVEIEVGAGVLVVQSPAELIKTVTRRIFWDRVTDLLFEQNRLTFSYEQEQYTFVDYGNGVLNYLSKQLA